MTELKKKILVVDDELSICRLLKRILIENNYACDYALSAAEALQKIAAVSFDLVVTDIKMPEMDGLQLIEKLRVQFPELAILVSTGVNEREVALKALELGAYGYMLKPCDDFEVMIHVATSLRRAELEKISRSYRQELESQVAERTASLEAANRTLEETNRLLRQQEKLASIGQLAAGIAHEIKTPTGFIASNLGSLKKYQERLLEYIAVQKQMLDESGSKEQQAELKSFARKLKIEMILDDAVELVENCLDGTGRINAIIHGLKDFSRQDQIEADILDLNKVIEDSLLLVRNELKYKTEVQTELTEIPKFLGYQQRLGQVFINLLVNAAHAIKKQGVITVSTHVENNEVIATVTDDGCGIPEGNLQKIFEPFYTTKEIGVGTGLGLSIIKDIIDQHQGGIAVESTVGKGTTFTLRFPI